MDKQIIETFEHDIADEVRSKEASISDIVTAVGDITTNSEKAPETNSSRYLIGIVIVLVVCGLFGAGYMIYSYAQGGPVTQNSNTDQETTTKKPSSGVSLDSLSPTISQAIGSHITKVEKTKYGYILSIDSYSPVFAYMLKNENLFVNELAEAVKSIPTGKSDASSNVGVKKDAPVVSTSTTVASGTPVTPSSSTTIEVKEKLSDELIFSDITISNQDIRVALSTKGSVAYAFIGTQKIVISSSEEGVLQLRGSILQK